MPLPLPELDTRTWQELVAEARAQIPRYAPEWTDQNYHDPGITLLELFAWLSEILIYRTDRVPPAELRAFLRWFGIEPLTAQPAATVLALKLPPGNAAASAPGGLKVADPQTGLVFEADDPILVSPAWIELSASEGTHRGRIFSEADGVLIDLTSDNGLPGFEFFPLGRSPRPDDALWLGFDVQPAQPGDVLSLYVWTKTWATDGSIRAALLAEETGRSCPVHPDLHYSARTTWEAWDGTQWSTLEVIGDETRALSLSGFVRLKFGMHAAGPPDAPDPADWWIRCRLVSGSYECPPQLAAIAANAVASAHAARITGPELLGTSQGHAREVYRVAGTIVEQGANAVAQPVLAGTLKVRLVSGASQDDAWSEVLEWDRTGAYDRHYRLDSSTNSVAFGDGRVGYVPPADWSIEALEYYVGGDTRGNLPAGRLTQILAGGVPNLEVMQPFAATGGAAAETLDQAHARALELINRPARGITVADWEFLTLETPGVPVARAVAIPGFHPDFACWTALGVVTVVVVPSCGSPPSPGPDFLSAVARYLEPRRPLTTELHVVGPNYVKVTVTATLHVTVAAPGLAAQAQAALAAFFDPLTGGRDGTGWPLGRGVLQSDLLALLAKLPGVSYVDGLGITGDSGPALCDDLTLCPTDLVASQTHQITITEG